MQLLPSGYAAVLQTRLLLWRALPAQQRVPVWEAAPALHHVPVCLGKAQDVCPRLASGRVSVLLWQCRQLVTHQLHQQLHRVSHMSHVQGVMGADTRQAANTSHPAISRAAAQQLSWFCAHIQCDDVAVLTTSVSHQTMVPNTATVSPGACCISNTCHVLPPFLLPHLEMSSWWAGSRCLWPSSPPTIHKMRQQKEGSAWHASTSGMLHPAHCTVPPGLPGPRCA